MNKQKSDSNAVFGSSAADSVRNRETFRMFYCICLSYFQKQFGTYTCQQMHTKTMTVNYKIENKGIKSRKKADQESYTN